MKSWSAEEVAAAAGAQLISSEDRSGAPAEDRADAPGPGRAVIDSREAGPGDLFVGLRGERHDGGVYAAAALAGGAWGAIVAPEHVRAARAAAAGVLMAHPHPLAALQRLARAWRRELGAHVVGVTGSTGKTSTKDILAALLSRTMPTVASPANLNTEIGLPLAILQAPPGTRALVLEMAMRGPGQIAELTAIAEPDVGVIVNVGPVHLELLGSVEAVAAAKAELIAGMSSGGTVVLPAGESLLEPHVREDHVTLTFGEGGDVQFVHTSGEEVTIAVGEERFRLRPSFDQSHHLTNLLAAVAAARALGVSPQGEVEVSFSALRGERLELPGQVVLVNDCYNANPMSMVAALEELSRTASGRTVAVLGDMLELGPEELRFHREVGADAARVGVDELITVGPLAAAMAAGFGRPTHSVEDAAAASRELLGLLREGDTVLVKGSRGVGLERVAEDLLSAVGSA